MRALRLTMLASLGSMFIACGSGGNKLPAGKDNAMNALGAAQSVGGTAASSSPLLAGAASFSGTKTCPMGGSVTVAASTDSATADAGGTVQASLTLTFDHCVAMKYDPANPDGGVATDGGTSTGQNVEYTGSLTYGINLVTTQGSEQLVATLKGKVTLTGGINDYLDANITETFAFTAGTSTTPAGASITVNGTLATSTQSYTYTNETITFNPGKIHKA